MKEHTKKKVNVLGIDVSVMRPEKAVNITMNYINRKEVNKIYFHSAASSVFCQANSWAAEWMDSCDLIFAGDKSMEQHIISQFSLDNLMNTGNTSFADSYTKRLLYRLNREGKEIFTVVSNSDQLSSLKEYVNETYPNIIVQGDILTDNSEAESERVVNEINGYIPDIVFLCIPSDLQIQLMSSYQSMINTSVLIGIESLLPMIKTETVNIPGWVQKLHLTGLYQWFKKDGKLENQIIRSMFERSIIQDDVKNSEEIPDDIEKENNKDFQGEE